MGKAMTKAERLAARWEPIDGVRNDHPALDAVVWFYESSGRPAACAYQGGKQAPAFNGNFETPERRNNYVNDWLENLKRVKGVRAAAAAEFVIECDQFFAALTLGTVFYYTDGYEQTNAHFFQVVGRVTANAAVVQPIAHTKVESRPMSMSGHAVPVIGEFTGDLTIFKIKGAVPNIWKEDKPPRISWYG